MYLLFPKRWHTLIANYYVWDHSTEDRSHLLLIFYIKIYKRLIIFNLPPGLKRSVDANYGHSHIPLKDTEASDNIDRLLCLHLLQKNSRIIILFLLVKISNLTFRFLVEDAKISCEET